jgi:hypothetical protein
MPNATERKALVICAFFAGLLCAIPMVGKVAIAGTSARAILQSVLGVLRALIHPTLLGVWGIAAVLLGLHLFVSYREAKLEEQAMPAGDPEPPAVAPPDESAVPETPGGA